jgi:cytochrome c nitrite reductase small subunit
MIRQRGRTSLHLVAAALIGVAVGVGGYTFVYAKGAAYMTNDPGACANCHVMREHYDAWRKSSHHAVAVCNDCHTPSGFFGKYSTKAINGWNHSVAFTSGNFHDPIEARPWNKEIAEANCRRCHADLSAAVDGHGEQLSCVRCHESVGHQVRAK